MLHKNMCSFFVRKSLLLRYSHDRQKKETPFISLTIFVVKKEVEIIIIFIPQVIFSKSGALQIEQLKKSQIPA